jgi:ADP-ribose pyrophosphatase
MGHAQGGVRVLPAYAMHHHSHLVEDTLDSKEILRSHFLQVMCDTVRLPGGKTATRDYIVHPGAVMVVPLLDTPSGLRVVLERQYRYPVRQAMVEFPAGKLEPGENTLVCGMRELQEETGYTAAEWAHAGVIHPCIAYSTECIDVWFARSLQLGPRHLDEGEFLDVFTASPAELLRWCCTGEVTDAKTLSGSLWLQNVLSGAWTLDWQTAA